MTKTDKFTGKTVLVTGAAAGIGRALCLALARSGALVYAADINKEGLDQLRGTIGQDATLSTTLLDVSRLGDFQRTIDEIISDHGRLDIIINNAGIVLGGDFGETSLEDIKKIIDINLWGVIYGTKLAYTQMRLQGHGHIANISSSAGMMPVPNSTMYSAIKHAIIGLSHSLREEAALHGIEITSVLPGMVQSDLWDNALNVGKYDYKKSMQETGIKPISAEDAATAILSGISQNKRSIIFPRFNRIILRLYQLMPNVMTHIALKPRAKL